MDHAEVMNSCDAKAERVGLAHLGRAERVIVFVSRANFEIELGGLSGFFYNSAGDHAAETVPALEAVGAKHAATALRAAMALFAGASSPPDRQQRYAAMQAMSGSFGKLDSEFASDEPDVFSRLCLFIDGHAAELQEHQALAGR
jgi:hypothetical protein